jgi:uncharacterized protein YhfF
MKAEDAPETIHALLKRYPGAALDEFGDSPELSRRLIGLVRAGRKTACCGALRDYLAAGDPVPTAGQYQIVLDHEGTPALVLRMVSVRTLRFIDVDWDFARDEGEDDDLEGWRAGHRAFFARTGGFGPDMPLVCQRFELAEDLAAG